MKHIFFYNFVLLLVFFGCSEKQPKQPKISSDTLIIPLDFSEEPIDIHEIGLINDIEIFHLDYKDAIFGEADKIIRHKDRIYLMDSRQTKSVIIYDDSCKFVNLLAAHGQGPKEYLELTDIFVDTALNIVSQPDGKILQYDLDGSNFLGAKRLPKRFNNISATHDGYVGYMRNNSSGDGKLYNLWTMSANFEIKDYFHKIDETWVSRGFGNGSAFSSYKSKTYHIAYFDYNIYSIEKDGISIPYSFDIGKLALPDKYKKSEMFDHLLKENIVFPYIDRFYHFQETENHLIVSALYMGQNLLGVYNKQNNKSHIVKLGPNMEKYFFGFGRIVSFDENTIYTLIRASEAKRMWVGKDQYNDFTVKYSEQIKRLRKRFDHIDEDDNPYLVVYSIN